MGQRIKVFHFFKTHWKRFIVAITIILVATIYGNNCTAPEGQVNSTPEPHAIAPTAPPDTLPATGPERPSDPLVVSRFYRKSDPDGDGIVDLVIHIYSLNQFWIVPRQIDEGVSFSHSSQPGKKISGDFDGDKIEDLGVVGVMTGSRENIWSIRYSSDGAGASFRSRTFGPIGPQPCPADFDGDGITDLALYGGSTTSPVWMIQLSTRPAAETHVFRSITASGTQFPIAMPGYYDNDLLADRAILVRDSAPGAAQTVLIDLTTTGTTQRIPIPEITHQFKPEPGDFDGDGITDLAFYHLASRTWVIRSSRTGSTETLNFSAQLLSDLSIPLEAEHDYYPGAADYDGDSKEDPMIFDSTTVATGTANWYYRSSRTGRFVHPAALAAIPPGAAYPLTAFDEP